MQNNGFSFQLAASRATDKPHQTMNPPKCRPIRPKPSFVGAWHLMGLHFGNNNAPDRDLIATNRGNCTTRASGTPTTHRQQASCSANPHRIRTTPIGLAAVPVGGGRACRHTNDKRRPIGGRRGACGAKPRGRWAAAGPGRASRSTTPSAARVWRSRGRAAAHRHTQRPGPTKQAPRRPEICRGSRPHGARNTRGATSNTKPPGPTGDRAAHASGR